MGNVKIKRLKIIRLLRDAITTYIRNGIKSSKKMTIEISKEIQDYCDSNKTSQTVQDIPPCVKQCILALDNGINVPQNGRFLLASFFIHAGYSNNEIGDMFRGAPDYSERITKYHINHIREKEYSIPSCMWVKQRNLCPGCKARHPSAFKDGM